MERCRREADVSFRQVCRDSREAAQGAQPLVRSVATQTARTFGSPGRSLAERTIHGRRPCIEVRPSVPSGIFNTPTKRIIKVNALRIPRCFRQRHKKQCCLHLQVRQWQKVFCYQYQLLELSCHYLFPSVLLVAGS